MKGKLSHKRWISLALICLGFVLQVHHRYHFRKFAIDTEVLMIVAANMERGLGKIIFTYNPADAVQPIPALQSAFMPGYAYLLRGMSGLTIDKLLTASWYLEILAIGIYFLLVILWWRRMQSVATKQSIYTIQSEWLFALFLAFSITPLHYLPIGDLLCLLGLLAGTLALMSNQKGTLSYFSMLLAVGGLGFSFWVRYAYLPFIALVPLFAGYVYWQHKSRTNGWKFIFAGLLSLLAAAALIGSQGFAGTNLEAAGPNWFPTHLLSVEPFPFKAFFYYGLSHELALAAKAQWLAWGLKLGAFLFSIGLLALILMRTKGRYRLLILATMGLNLALIGYFSLTVPAEDWNSIGFWTYLMETRYYMPSMWWVLLTSFLLAGRIAWLRWGLTGIVGMGIVLWAWTNYHVWMGTGNYTTFSERVFSEVVDFSAQITGPDPTLTANYDDCRLSEVFSYTTIPYEQVIAQEVSHSVPIQVYVLLPTAGKQSEQEMYWKSLTNTQFVEETMVGEWWRYQP